MSASISSLRFPGQPAPVEPWLASHDALDLAAEIAEAGIAIRAAGDALMDHLADRAALNEAEAAARRTLALVGRLRAVGGAS